MTFIYGRCEPPPRADGGCAPPLDIQVQPLCAHLEAVALAPIWKRRRVRGAPVGTIDGAPVLFSNRVQVKVYAKDRRLAMRALRALRSVNAVEPVIDADDAIPAPPPGVLDGTRACRSD